MRADQPHTSFISRLCPAGSVLPCSKVVVVALADCFLVACSLGSAVRQRGRCLGGRDPHVVMRLSSAASL